MAGPTRLDTQDLRDLSVGTTDISGSAITPAKADLSQPWNFQGGISGSLQNLTNGQSYLAAGSNVTITSGSSGQVTIAAAAGGSSPFTVLSLAANATANATTTGVEITGLQTALTSGRYVFQYFIIGRSSITTTGLKFGINYTGTTTSFRASMRITGTGTAAVTGIADDANTAAQIVEGFATRTLSTTAPNMGPYVGVATINQDILHVIEGIIIVSTSGDLELWHGSETAASTQVMAGSSLILTRVS